MIKLYRISEKPERCPMCKSKATLYDFDFKSKFGDNLCNLTICGECVKKCIMTLQDFSKTMLGEDNEY